jgi:hypothetical protein
MKKLHTGLIVFDVIDIIVISFSIGSSLAFLIKKYKEHEGEGEGEDLLVAELKKKSPLIIFSENDKPLKLPLVRGGDELEGFSLFIKSKKLANLITAIISSKKKQQQLRFLRIFFFTLNKLLTNGFSLRFALGGSLNYTQFILISCPSTLTGLIIGLVIANPLTSILLPLTMLYIRGIEDIPDPYQNCKAICKIAEEFHNKQLMIEMKELNSLVEGTSTALQGPVDKVHLLCAEEKLSLIQRYKLKEVIRNKKTRKSVQHFSEFIKKFPECDPDLKVVNEQINII